MGMIGLPLPRSEDARLITGAGRYTDDFATPGARYCAFVRAAHAHADIAGIDADEARAMPGVVAVLTLADYRADGHRAIDHMPNPGDPVDAMRPALAPEDGDALCNILQWPLADGRVRYVGEPIAMVVAESPEIAADAAEAVFVDYAELPGMLTIDDALAADADAALWPQAPGNRYFSSVIGDEASTAAAFAEAAHVFSHRFFSNRVVNCQMEPRSIIASHDPDTGLSHAIAGSQGVHRMHMMVCACLSLAPDRLRVVSPDVGGGFGPRSVLQPEQLLLPWAALRLGGTLRWTSSRSEAFLVDYQGRDAVGEAALAVDAAGRITAYRVDLATNVGAYPISYVPAANAYRLLTTVYDIPRLFGRVQGIATNTVPTVPYRGAGRPEAHHCLERIIDIAADGLGIDPLEFRRRNLIAPEAMPYRTATGLVYDSGDFIGNMDKAAEAADWAGFPTRRAAAAARGRLAGIAIANHVETPNGAPMERVDVTIQPDGVVEIVAGTQSTGQGHETSFAQVGADLFGVALEKVRLRTGDTALATVGGGTHSDRSMRIISSLLADAADTFAARWVGAAGLLLDRPTELLRFAGGSFIDATDGHSISLTEIAAAVAADMLPENLSQPVTARCDFFGRIPAYPTGSAVCELEIDRDTGDIAVTRYTCVDDVGQVINPLIVHGQTHGAIVQGIGQALFEGVFHEDGQVVTGSFMDYGVARAIDVPSFTTINTEDPTAGNPMRIKGGGEGGIIPATAVVVSALCDALREYGVTDLVMPVTRRTIWEAMNPA